MQVRCTVGGTINVDRNGILITHRYGAHTIVFSDKTLNQILIELNSLPYISATLNQPTFSYMLAKGILATTEQDIELDGSLYMSGSIFYNEMQVYAGKLQEQSDRLLDAEKQLYLHAATDTWLDYWARDYFGNPRKTGETDGQYTPRVIAEIIRLTQNNKAMEVLLAQAIPELDIEITDAPARNWDGRDYRGEFDAIAEIDAAAFVGTPIREDYWATIETTANKVKAAGTRLKTIALYYKLVCQAPIVACAAFMGEEITIHPYELTEITSETGPQYFAAALYSHEAVTIQP